MGESVYYVCGKGIAAKHEAQAFDHQIKAQKKLKQTTIPQSKSKIYVDDLSPDYIDNCRANGKDGKWLKDLIKLPESVAGKMRAHQ